jgi:hypothetical protein
VDQRIEGKTALQIASYEGYVDVVKFLLENKADPNLKDKEDDSPLHYSAFGYVYFTVLNYKSFFELVEKTIDA